MQQISFELMERNFYIDCGMNGRNNKMEKRKLVTPNDIATALKDIGVQKGQTIMVHTSLSSLGYVCGGAQSVIEALLERVGDEGTIMMPTQSWKNLDPSSGVYWQEPEEWWPVIRESIPAYDKRITPTNTMGAVYGSICSNR